MAFETQVFRKGDRVAWSHRVAIFHEATVMSSVALDALFPTAGADEGDRVDYGTVVAAANAEKTYYEVKLDSGETRVFTFEELTKVADG